jgi:hypothetical protein
MRKCKLCKKKTENYFNINFELVSVCEDCASTIFLQQANWYVKDEGNNHNQNERMKKWFAERTGLKNNMLSKQMQKIDEMLKK